MPKTAQTTITVTVPIVECTRCKKEAPCLPRLQSMPNGAVLLVLAPPFVEMHIGNVHCLLCEACHHMIAGALYAAGVMPPEKPTGTS